MPGRLRVLRVASTGSTNDDARALASAGAPHGTAVSADVQTGGRGRLGRTWVATGGSVALSIVLRPDIPAERLPLVCLAAAVGTAEVCGPGWRIDWPNDVVDDRGRKVAGILAEAEWAGGRPAFVVVGIGVNVGSAPTGLDGNEAACLGPDRQRDEVADAVGAAVLRWVDAVERDPEAVLAAWRARAGVLGARVRITGAGGQVVSGVARDIDAAGALLVDGDDGVAHRILAGDVRMIG